MIFVTEKSVNDALTNKVKGGKGANNVYSEPLTRNDAVKFARAWCDDNVRRRMSYRGRSQFRWMMEQMGTLCVAESLRNNEDEDHLSDRLAKAYEILRDVWWASAPEIATYRQPEKPDENQQKVIDKAEATIWKRRNPKRSFAEGFESDHHTAFNQDSFHGTVANYLKEQWLRHPDLDWIMLDMMISRELSAFGEMLKQNLPYARNLFGGRYSRYFACKGNLHKMKKLNWRNLIILLPLGVIYSAIYIGNEKVSDIIAGRGNFIVNTCVIAAVAVLGWQIFLLVLFYWEGRRWDRMYAVWRLLEGPIVNPSLVRETMIATRKKGVIWDMPAWSIIDRVIQHDPAVWIVQGD